MLMLHMSPKVNTPHHPPSSPIPSHKHSVALATNNGEGDRDSLCYQHSCCHNTNLPPTSPPHPRPHHFCWQGQGGLLGDGLCCDDNNIVVVITQTALPQALLALTLAIFAGEGKEGCGRQLVL